MQGSKVCLIPQIKQLWKRKKLDNRDRIELKNWAKKSTAVNISLYQLHRNNNLNYKKKIQNTEYRGKSEGLIILIIYQSMFKSPLHSGKIQTVLFGLLFLNCLQKCTLSSPVPRAHHSHCPWSWNPSRQPCSRSLQCPCESDFIINITSRILRFKDYLLHSYPTLMKKV
jgi:hypothetical protein